jgi:hypothetical protein
MLAISPHGLTWANNTGALKDATGRLVRYGLVGSPDILACIKGRFVGIECKVGRDWQKPAQKAFAAALTRAGGIYLLARSVDDVTACLTAEGLIDG